MNRRERIEKAILIYEDTVIEALKLKRRIFIISLVSPVSLAIAAFISIIRSDLSALITSIGLGGANLAAIYGSIGKEIKTYLTERALLKLSIKKLRIELTLCENDDRDCMGKVEDKLRGYLEKLAAPLT